MKTKPKNIESIVKNNGTITLEADKQVFSFLAENADKSIQVSIEDADIEDYMSWFPKVWFNNDDIGFDRWKLIDWIGQELDDHIHASCKAVDTWCPSSRYHQEIRATFN